MISVLVEEEAEASMGRSDANSKGLDLPDLPRRRRIFFADEGERRDDERKELLSLSSSGGAIFPLCGPFWGG